MGTVVTRDVPPHALVVGNPARCIGLVARDGTRVWQASTPGELPPNGTVIECGDDSRLVIHAEPPRVRHEA